ncbi:unnamed protein product, partial [Musa textilis]
MTRLVYLPCDCRGREPIAGPMRDGRRGPRRHRQSSSSTRLGAEPRFGASAAVRSSESDGAPYGAARESDAKPKLISPNKKIRSKDGRWTFPVTSRFATQKENRLMEVSSVKRRAESKSVCVRERERERERERIREGMGVRIPRRWDVDCIVRTKRVGCNVDRPSDDDPA